MHLFFHQTSILAVDDDETYLDSFRFRFDDNFQCETFSRVDEALSFIKLREMQRYKVRDLVAPHNGFLDANGLNPGDSLVHVKGGALSNIVELPQRSQQLSVAIVDYQMPGINGIEFCRHISNMPIKKILLTGKADASRAVSAFNEGIIDYFITKHQPDAISELEKQILDFQQKYFFDISTSIKGIVSLEECGFLYDPEMNAVFSDIFDNKDISEYYLSPKIPGFVLYNSQSKPLLMPIFSDDVWDAHIENSNEENAPQELMRMLSSKSVIPLFPNADGLYSGEFKETWRDHLWPSRRTSVDSKYTYALVDVDQT